MKLYFRRLAQRLPEYISAMGPFAGIRYLLIKIREKFGLAPAEVVVHAKSLAYPLRLRTRPSSDSLVFEQVCVDGEFDFLNQLSGSVRFVLDLGSNIGCASALFLSVFPDATLIAVEPDPENAARCRDNLRPYGNRSTVITGAVWHTSGNLVLSREDGMEWAVRVREALRNEKPDVTAYSVHDLLKHSQFSQIDLLKIDIEGSEFTLFSKYSERWLGSVRNICIETHGTEAEMAVKTALDGFTYEASRVGEHDLYLNLSRNS